MDTYGNHSISVSLANDFPDWYERFPFREAARKCRWQDNFLLHTYEYFGNSQALHRPWTQDDGARPNDFVLLQCAAKSSSLAWIIGYDTFLLLSPTSIWCVSNGSHAVRMTLLLLVFYFDGNSSHHAHPDDTCTLQILLRTGHTGLLLHDRAAVYLWAGLPRGI